MEGFRLTDTVAPSQACYAFGARVRNLRDVLGNCPVVFSRSIERLARLDNRADGCFHDGDEIVDCRNELIDLRVFATQRADSLKNLVGSRRHRRNWDKFETRSTDGS